MADDKTLADLVLQLYDIQAVKFGNFTLKSGIQSPVYFDLRVIVSYPKLMTEVSELLWERVSSHKSKFVSVCGVPYTALPLATGTILCWQVSFSSLAFMEIQITEDPSVSPKRELLFDNSHNLPMLIRRKEAKDYGTKKIIEGHYQPGDNCLIVEDVVTSGTSVLETVDALEKENLTVTDAVVLLDREQGGNDKLASKNIKLHSVCTLTRILEILEKADKLNRETVDKVKIFIAENNTFNVKVAGDGSEQKSKRVKKTYSYSERAAICDHPMSKRLFNIMEKKKTNLAFSADVTNAAELLKLAESVGPYICMIKTHIDILEDFSEDLTKQLAAIAEKHNFLIFEDRKFADIGNTVKHQYGGGMYRISEWADIINAHALPGPGIVQGLKMIGESKGRGCLLIGEMSSKGNLATGDYTKATVKVAEENSSFVIGFICVSQLTQDPKFIHMTPGVQLKVGTDTMGQQYLTPEEVITNRLSDIIIVGRGIYEAENPSEKANEYKEAGYKAYQALLN